jgi:serpin B
MLLLFGVGCIGTDSGTNVDMGNTTNTSHLISTDADTSANSAEPETVNYNYLTNATSTANYDIASANNAFAFDMYANIKSKDMNAFFSPYSIFTAMAICYDGAEGSTKEQISNVLYYPLSKPVLEVSSKEMMDTINSANDQYDLKTANALWVQEKYPLNTQFVSNLETYYSGNIRDLDFAGESKQSVAIINGWVEEKTNNKIKDLVPADSISSDTEMIITNAIYFKGKWSEQFDPRNTKKEQFYSSNGNINSVDTMYSTMQGYSYAENSNEQIVELPYEGRYLSMYIVLPRENNISDFENRFSLSEYNNLKSSMNSINEVHLWLPKFTFDKETELSEQLSNMGIVDAFTDSADFRYIYDVRKVPEGYGLKLSAVIHQAFIDVQEEGTEAAAATAIIYETASMVEPPEVKVVEFKADHPFMFFIEDKRTGCILFMGKVETPEY